MNLEEFINKIKEIKIKVPDEHFFLEYNTEIYKIIEENQQLKEIHDKAINFIKNHIQETTYKYVYSNEVNVIQELHLDNEELIELLKILESSDNK